MSKTIPVPKNEFVSINTASGFAIGTRLGIQNTGLNNVFLYENVTEPSDPNVDYRLLPGYIYPNNETELAEGSDEAWVYSTEDTVISLEVL